ncbi:DUF3179 domain-containing protein [Halostella salina]|uniref:DUF3179 domain-containing protein n=1 Tax=Halostella salina TaxID=1547897 RepID=UPI000EF75A21|nr:DUF3179 domain-containing protein [Halostella salina]
MNVRQVVPRDAIPSVDDPEFADEYEGDPDDRVIALPDASPARAYPVRYLHYHEVVNDAVPLGSDDSTGGPEPERPVAVTWCPLCGSAVVYDRRVDDHTLEFGVSGKLADDDLVLYDRETDTEWKQSSGEAIEGPLTGETLSALPAALTTWDEFRASHPDGVVLAPPGGKSEASGAGDEPEPIDYDDAPYEAYFETEGFGLAAHRGEGESREWSHPDLAPKDVVVGIERGGDAVGVPLERVEAAGGVVHVTVGGDDFVVFATPDGVHAFETDHRFEPVDDGVFRADGARWDGATGRSDDGRTLDRAPVRRLFAFAWYDDHGDAFHDPA